ncbi:MAG TPA: metallophosphoesterase [Ignavibacteria bacterium]|nr:metallophosphoesterase [Ignavibacteria bacterium]
MFITIFVIYGGLQILAMITFRKFLKRKNFPKKWINWVSITPFVLFSIPFIYIVVTGARLTDLPEWLYDSYIIPFYMFTAAIFFIGFYLLIGKILKLPFWLTEFILNRFKKTKQWLAGFKQKKSVQKFDRSRRRFVTGAAAVASGYAFIGSGIAVLGKDDFEVTEREMKIKNLPAALKGTTLTLLCDVHSGPYMSEDVMRDYARAVNDVGSDIIVIPGDLTNSNISEATPFANAFRDLKAKHGVFGTLGNHDYFADADYVADVVRNETPIQLFRNESRILNINGEELCILGVDDVRRSNSEYDPEIMRYMDLTIADAKSKASNYEELPKVMLYHKPYFLNEAAKRNVDLLLSGHTHGGQVVLFKFGNTNISPAGTVSPYVSGLYTEGGTQMYVSRGLGVVGLPLRLNCPPEITKITLV